MTSADAIEACAGELRELGARAVFAHADVSRSGADVAAAVADGGARATARLHVLFNNAGIFPDADGSPVDTDGGRMGPA